MSLPCIYTRNEIKIHFDMRTGVNVRLNLYMRLQFAVTCLWVMHIDSLLVILHMFGIIFSSKTELVMSHCPADRLIWLSVGSASRFSIWIIRILLHVALLWSCTSNTVLVTLKLFSSPSSHLLTLWLQDILSMVVNFSTM